MRLIAEGKAPKITQPQEGATYECIQKKDNSKVIYRDPRRIMSLIWKGSVEFFVGMISDMNNKTGLINTVFRVMHSHFEVVCEMF